MKKKSMMIHVKSTVALRKQHKLLLQHITSREALDPLHSSGGTCWRPPQLREDESSLPRSAPRPGAREGRGGRDTGRTVSAGCYRTLVGGSLAGSRRPLSPLVALDKIKLSVPFDPPQLLHPNGVQFLWCAPGLPAPPSQLSCSQPGGHRIRLFKGW